MNLGSWIRRLSKSEEIAALERTLGYCFRDSALLETALVHPSYRFEHQGVKSDNQRLEFLGDAVLGLLAADYLFNNCEEIDEGRLTILRSQVASGKALSAIALEIGLGNYLRLGKGEDRSGGRTRPGILEDAMEAIFGAAWEDGGLRAAASIFETVVRPRLDMADERRIGGESIWAGNPKGHLQSIVQRRFHCNVIYNLLESGGTGHAPTFLVEARVDCENGPSASAQGQSKRKAEVAAAEKLIDMLDELGEGEGIPPDAGRGPEDNDDPENQ